MSNNFLLDTCALIWLADNGGLLSVEAKSKINDADILFVSSISAWEISLLHHKKRLILPQEPEKWWKELQNELSLVTIDISPSIAFLAEKLPLHHRDPCDRFIIATSMVKSVPVVTQDAKFENYGIKIIG